MSIFKYLQLQPVDPRSDGTTSDLDEFTQDEMIDLNLDVDPNLDQKWDRVLHDLTKGTHNTSDK